MVQSQGGDSPSGGLGYEISKEVKPLTEGDLDDVLNFRSWGLSADDRRAYTFLNGQSLLSGWLLRQPHDCWITRDSDGIAAFGHLTGFDGEGKTHVVRLGVAVAYRRQGEGLGRVMAEYLVRAAWQLGYEKIWLSVQSDNHRAIKLYESLGFKLEGVYLDEERFPERDVYSMALRHDADITRRKGHLQWCEPDWGVVESAAVIKTLQSGWWTQGVMVQTLEEKIAAMFGEGYAAACVSSGTDAILLVALADRMENGPRRLQVPAFAFPATVAPFKLLGYEFNYWDADPRTALSIGWLNGVGGPNTIAMDVGGALSSEPKCLLVDASQSFGVRNWTSARFTTFSFHAAKVMTTVEGGAVVGSHEDIAVIKQLRNHGAESGYIAKFPGLNCRMTDLQASVGLAQIERLSELLLQRDRVFDVYRYQLEMQAVVTPTLAIAKFAHHQEMVAAKKALAAKGIDTRRLWPPLPMQFGGTPSSMEYSEAQAWYGRGLMLPLSSKMTTVDAQRVVDIIKGANPN